ncbi:TonB-dependent receptor [Taibaiella sp. KBW10]|uniref:TonB-dependent receptor n=1 Tax=Taibaiella sp. KBW10 TaxID=2153357 RepID=UPI000F5AFA15|nr:TonB-dependent receptor [Taibaiella sp. KBW10]RQO30756.1 TonB-dependent receptor [Taibaiella sp. KBW10]
MRKPIIFLLVLLFPISLLAQKKVSISGYIKDAGNGETLIGAAVFANETKEGTAANTYGFYSLSLKPGVYTVRFSNMGFKEQTLNLNLLSDTAINIDLQNASTKDLEEVLVTAERADKNVSGTQMGTIGLSTEQIKKLPVVFGESDILKAIQLLPGVQSAGEGQSGFYVRGGGPDQNLVLLDEAVVYNTGHLFGFFSIFNSDAIKNVNLIKGGAPANYGGRLSSVLDVNMKDGNMKKFGGEGGIGLIASRLTLEGPIVKNKGSFMVSGRRTYIDVISKPFLKGNAKGSGYYFYDANLKANYILGKKDRLYLSGYFGKDVFNFNSGSGDFNVKVPWGNATSTLRWNHQFNDKLFMNVSAIYNTYNFQFTGGQKDLYITLKSGIRDWNGKVDFDYYAPFGHHFKYGVNYTYHKFTPSQLSGTSADSMLMPENPFIKYAHESALYLTDEFDLGPSVKINAGIRYSMFNQTGPYTSYTFDGNGNKMDSTVYGSGSLVKTYGGWEPRLGARISLSESSSIKTSISRSMQYVHLVSNNGSTLPTDVWMPSSLIVQPQKAWQYSLGYFQNFLNNALETSVEVYYKDLKNQIEYREGYTPNNIRDPESDLVFGEGQAYGAEFFINKTKGKFTGWIGYTLSWTNRRFAQLNNGDPFPAKYDRRHDLSIVANYEINKKLNVSAVFVYATGNAITLPTGYYFIDGKLIQDYSKINQYRIFPYHRLDLSLNYTPRANSKKRVKGTWAFSIYNVYSRQNPYLLYVSTEGTLQQGTSVKVKQVSIFPIIPSITYNFKF